MTSAPFIRAITPTLNRHIFLSKQLLQFYDMHKHYRGDAEWVIVDATAQPHPMLKQIRDTRITYIHLPSLDRAFLSETLLPKYPELAGSFLQDKDTAFIEYQRLLLRKKQEPNLYPPEIKEIPSWNNISLGEKRNIAIRINTGKTPPSIIVQLDDDDYYAKEYFNWVADNIQNAAALRHRDIPMYLQESNQWVVCEFKSRNPTKVISTNGEIIKEIQPEDVARLQAEGLMSHDGFGFGLAMAFKMAALKEVMRERDNKGPFPSISLYEDAILARRIIRLGYNINFATSDNYVLCRIMHANNSAGAPQSNISKRTRMHRSIPDNVVKKRYPDMAHGVRELLQEQVSNSISIPENLIRPQLAHPANEQTKMAQP